MGLNAFTSVYPGMSFRLGNQAVLKFNGKEISVKALWDTGATRTCISKEVVTALNLIPLGKQNMLTPSGTSIANTYLIDVFLPNNVTVHDLVVCDSEIGVQGIGALIGMDIIALGDFAVSNYGGKTAFTFRTPSQKRTDYVTEIKIQNTVGPKHGRGKGYSNK